VRVSRTVRVRIISSPVTATVVSDNSKPNDEEVGTSNTNTRMHTSGTEQQQQSDTINDYQSGCCQGGTGSYIEDRCQMRPSWCCAITIAMTVLFFVGLVMMGSDNSVQTEEEWEKDDETTMSDYGPIGKTGLVLCLFVGFLGVFLGYRFICINLVPIYGGWRTRGELRGRVDLDPARNQTSSHFGARH